MPSAGQADNTYLVEHIEETITETPEEEQGGDEAKRNDELALGESSVVFGSGDHSGSLASFAIHHGCCDDRVKVACGGSVAVSDERGRGRETRSLLDRRVLLYPLPLPCMIHIRS